MTADDFTKAAELADELAAALRRAADDLAWTSCVSLNLDRLADVLPALREELDRRRRAKLTAEIAAAAGAATTHPWFIDEHLLVTCSVCQCSPGAQALAKGQVPPCTPTPSCAHSIFCVKTETGVSEDLSECIFCKTVYPTTAELECAQ